MVFQNSENGYTVLSIFTENGSVTATGKFPILGIGERVELEGEFKVNQKYGRQFEAQTIQIVKPTTLSSIRNYLSCGLISGVGEITANSIVNMFGEKTLEIIEFYPEELAKVRGISLKKAADIGMAFKEIKKMQEAVMFLQQYDISLNLSVKIYNKYKASTQKILSENPYCLIEDIDGIGFKTADKIASKMGIGETSQFRLRAGLIYTLKQIAELKGSTVVFRDTLIAETQRLLEISGMEEAFESVIISLMITGKIKDFEYNGQSAIAINSYYSMEKFIASKLLMLRDNGMLVNTDFEREIGDYQQSCNITLHKSQLEAIKTGVSSGVAIITGGPGTGKTTIIKGMLRIFKNAKLKCGLMAPTGRASKRLEEQTGEEASTIHRALEMQGKGDGMFLRNERNPLDYDVVIVDEVSMIDDFVMSSLLKAIRVGSRLILVGDKDQLPSVGAGNVLADILASKMFDTVNLTQIFRQSDDSSIIVNSHKINDGEMPNLLEKSSDFFYSSTFEPEAVLREIVELVTTRIPNYAGINCEDIQVMAPMKAGIAGVDNINAELQKAINPPSPQKPEIAHGKRVFRVGDKVMQIKNNYDQEWVKIDGNIITHGNGVFNGDIGYIDDINVQTQNIVVSFEDGRRAGFSLVDYENLTHAYAITIHKSQGSEFPVVIIPILGGNPMLFNRNLLYTAVTRAKSMVVLIGKQSSIYQCVKNNYIQKRFTMLKDFLCQNI
ncbi:MAG: ATP-dependent RecD-like DNA helicase [Clostridia bacterium]|nr:ATP-dependent RecD-like DNA helicase [Clostridia bacterium]